MHPHPHLQTICAVQDLTNSWNIHQDPAWFSRRTMIIGRPMKAFAIRSSRQTFVTWHSSSYLRTYSVRTVLQQDLLTWYRIWLLRASLISLMAESTQTRQTYRPTHRSLSTTWIQTVARIHHYMMKTSEKRSSTQSIRMDWSQHLATHTQDYMHTQMITTAITIW